MRSVGLRIFRTKKMVSVVGVGMTLIAMSCLSDFVSRPAAAESILPDNSSPVPTQANWALELPTRPAIPVVENSERLSNPIDNFVLSRLESAGLELSSTADRIALLRRVTFDLIGLPPTPAEVNSFVQDTSIQAYERVVERLLADPRYGERWGQHWLDVVRYADSDGFEYDDPRPHAWRYRDWVIRSLNRDKPYDQFVREQIAGDELFTGDMQVLAATGLHRLGPLRLNAGMQDEEQNRQEVLTEITDAIGSAFLGMTVGCARCHDHKFDDFGQADYFGLQAFFAGTVAEDVSLVATDIRAQKEEEIKAWKELRGQIDKKLQEFKSVCRERLIAKKRTTLSTEVQAALQVPVADRTIRQWRLAVGAEDSLQVTDEEVEASFSEKDRKQHSELLGEMRRHAGRKPAPAPAVMAVLDNQPTVPRTYILRRGIPGDHLREVGPHFPEAIQVKNQTIALNTSESKVKSAGRRTALAYWLSSSDHPLTARVMVNRLWQHHFGRGIVATPNNFGITGIPPSHPELLDWLATDFMAGGWRVKRMHRLMVQSATYCQSNDRMGRGQQVDPDNRLWWRMNVRRLEAEILRDSVLSVAGTLNLKVGGPGVRLPLHREVAALQYKGTWQSDADTSEHMRRSVYIFLKRNLRSPFFDSFDAPSTMLPCGVRSESTHAGQALELMNSDHMNQSAWSLARRLILECGNDKAKMIARAYRLALARPPDTGERQLALTYLARQTRLLQEQADSGNPPRIEIEVSASIEPFLAAALADFCLVIFNLDEFLFVD
jgi:hypothetical protein